mmetsp:Transcript_26681/g.80007  ORF Transcript_26681/g.80007 Transcript_26681/m.80007 type:complete len:222 (+) Transcript_26681:1232-1897(+)
MPSRMGVITSTSARLKRAESVASPGGARASAAKYCTGPSKSTVAYCELMRLTNACSWRSSVEKRARERRSLEADVSSSLNCDTPDDVRRATGPRGLATTSPWGSGVPWPWPVPSTTCTKTSSSASSGCCENRSSNANNLCTRPLVGSSVSTPRKSARPWSWPSSRRIAPSVGGASARSRTTSGSMPTGHTEMRVRWPSCSMWSGDVSMPSTISQDDRKWRA